MATDARLVASSVRRILAISVVVIALAAAGCATSKTTSPPVPLLSITSTHVGNFTQGQNGATYTLTVSNAAGAAATSGLVTVTETVPNGMTLVSMAGNGANGWTCAVLPTCTRNDALAAGASYPTITVTVNVALNASTPESNQASVSGGGSVSSNAPADSTTIVAVPQLSITSTHHGSFTQGQNGATYTVTVSNAAGAAATNGTVVTVTETLPAGMTLVSMAGNGANGWTCPGGNTCTRNDALAAGSSYPTITVTVNVTGGASSGTNQVQASGGGSAAANGNDLTTVFAAQTGCAGTPTGSESLLNGKYAFVAQGFIGANNLSPVAFAGSITADGQGNITGEEDSNTLAGNGGYQHLTIAAGSFYTAKTTANGNTGCLAFVFSGGTTTVATFHIALGGIAQGGAPANVASTGRLIEFDDNSNNGSGSRTSGILRFQTTANFTSALATRYAFGLDGDDSAGNHYAMAGSFTNNGNDLSFDTDDGGTTNHVAGDAGVVSGISAADGRGTFTITGGGKASHEEAYVVNTNELFLVQTDAFNVNTPILSGMAIVTPGAYTSTSLSGKVVVHATGNNAGVADVNLGLLTITPGAGNSGTFAGSITEYDVNSGASTNAIAGNYTVDATLGRTTLTGANTPVLYLATATDGISAFAVGTDPTAIFGFIETQSSVTVPVVNYAFGTEDPGDSTQTDLIGTVDIVAPAPGTATFTFDQSEVGGLITGSAISGVPVTPNGDGTGTFSGPTFYVTTGTRVFFLVEAGGAVLWDLDQ